MNSCRIGVFKITGLAIAAIIVIEIAVRASGIANFPIYNVDSTVGYIPKANQSGIFLNKNDWYFNDKNMPIAQNWDSTIRPNILLIGNSIVMGGDVYRQDDKLAPLIQKRLGIRPEVWPIATGGWTQINEMAYLDRHPEIAGEADYFAWEYMAGSLSGATPWAGEYVFPSHRPIYATWYVLRRYVLPRFFDFSGGSELPVTGQADNNNVAKFDSEVGALVRSANRAPAGMIWLYPTAVQLDQERQGKEWLPERGEIEEIARKYGLGIVDMAAKPAWNRTLYRDDGVHPNVDGNGVLASILASEFTEDEKRSEVAP
jgi:hypothetical protein